MSNLRKQVLHGGKSNESRKTVSRKARSRPESGLNSKTNSPITSPGTSRPSSRPGSRYPSDDEDSDSDAEDHESMSTSNSLSDSENTEAWADRLNARIAELQDRKHSNGASRVAALDAYLYLVRHHVAESQLERSLADIVPNLLKSIKMGTSAEERNLAAKALSVTILTCPSEDAYQQAFDTLRQACEDDDDEDVKASLVNAMAMTVVYGVGDDQEMEEFLDYLTQVIESDGELVNAPDSGKVVSTALQAWAFVATNLESLDAPSFAGLEAFVEQLGSGDADVQAAAAVNIALLFEVSRDLEEGDSGESLNLHVDPNFLIKRMGELARGSKSISKKSRKSLRSSLANVITSLELGKGPGWSAALRQPAKATALPASDELAAFGYRERITIRGRQYGIESWSTLIRVEMMKRLLRGGFASHVVDNTVVNETLGDLKPKGL